MRTFFCIKGRSGRRVVHTSDSYASAGVLLCGCGITVRDDRVKEAAMGKYGPLFPEYVWCEGCYEAFLAEKTAEILSMKDPAAKAPRDS